MLNTVVQIKGFPLDSLLAKVMVQDLAELSLNLTKPDIHNLSKLVIGIAGMMTNDDAENLTKPNIRSVEDLADWPPETVKETALDGLLRPVHELGEGFSGIAIRGRQEFKDTLRGSFVTNTRGEFLESIKKGSTHCTALFDAVTLNQSSAMSDFDLRRWRRFISPLAAAIKKPAVLSPSSFIFSISSKSSRGSLTETCRERLFFLPVAIAGAPVFRWCSVYTGKLFLKALRWCSPCYTVVVFTLSTGKEQVTHKMAKPGSALTLSGPLTTDDRLSIEVAMFDHITPISGRDSLTPKKYHYRFLALSRADAAARPCRVSIEAITEQEARRALAPLFILSLAARIPVLEAAL
ncbi:host cell division inhibitor Icd-like protein [Erwinia persicina]|uniref:Uncharacterized protein n=1 Tax=Erwinia persicina TaxID=55211 RepID=A0A4U3FKH1_9GAMM|nr:hypothetical protein EpCFBP13511_03275 [Erwinia persicina]